MTALRTSLRLLSLLGAALLGSALLTSATAFVLCDGGGKAWALSDHLGRERLLFVVNPSAGYLDKVRLQGAALQVRDLRVVALLPPGDARLKVMAAPMLTLLADPGGTVSARYGPAALIGKDGGIKASYKVLPDLAQVIGTVDSMPMRVQERRERGQ